MKTTIKLLLECGIGFLIAVLIAYGLAVTIDEIEFVYRDF